METKRLNLVLMQREDVLAMVAAQPPEVRAEFSPVWLARIRESNAADPWTHGFSMMDRVSGQTIGHCAFKGPPNAEGVVEIAYGVHEAHQKQGYATESAEALARFAFDDARVRVVIAHTYPNSPASQRVLTKCGFQFVGEVIDPEDGLVWRWEKGRQDSRTLDR